MVSVETLSNNISRVHEAPTRSAHILSSRDRSLFVFFTMLVASDHLDDDDQAYRRRRRRKMIAWLHQQSRVVTFRDLMDLEGRRRRDRNLPRCALPAPKESPWQHCFDSRDDGALITVTGFDHSAFNELLVLFEPVFNAYTPWTGKKDGFSYRPVTPNKSKGRGRRRLVSASSCLGLVLAWYRFRGGEFILQGWFGFTGGHTNVWLRFGRRMLLRVLCKNHDARVRFPTEPEIQQYKAIVNSRHKSLVDVYCTLDGCKLKFQSCNGLDEQSMYYNGWLHGHYVTNLFMFGACGRIIACVLNVPGSVHDSTLAVWGRVYEKLERAFDLTGGIACVDSAFAANRSPYLIQSSQELTQAKTGLEMQQMLEATSMRQASEWGMRAIQGSFPRMKDPIKYELNGERGRIIRLLPLLYNFRLEQVGLNQLRSTYVPLWSRDADFFIK